MRIYAPSRMQSAKDMPGQTQLKFRCGGTRAGLLPGLAGAAASTVFLPPLPPSSLAPTTAPASSCLVQAAWSEHGGGPAPGRSAVQAGGEGAQALPQNQERQL